MTETTNKRNIFNEVVEGFSALSAEREGTQVIKTEQITYIESPQDIKKRNNVRNKTIAFLKQVEKDIQKMRKNLSK